MEQMHHSETPYIQSPEEKERFQYESRLQKKLAERAYPNESVPLMKWADEANTDGYSALFRAWLDDPKNTGEHPALDNEEAIDRLFEKLRGPTLH